MGDDSGQDDGPGVIPAPQARPRPELSRHIRAAHTPAPIAGYPTSAGLRRLADLADQGRLRIIIDTEYDLDQIEQAFAHYGHHTLGNICQSPETVKT